MSYFALDNDRQNVINEDKRDISMKDTKKRTYATPRHTTPHSDATKKLISDKQHARYDMIRQLVNQNTITEQRVRDICHQVLDEYISSNAKMINNNKRVNINL